MRHLVSWLFCFLDVLCKFCTHVLFNMHNKDIFFKEIQRFTQWWIWLPLLTLFFYSMVHILLEYNALQEIFVGSGMRMFLPVIVPLCVFLLFWNVRLETVITAKGLYVKLFPLHLKFKFICWEAVSAAYIRQYRPLTEFGGWGLRYGFGGKAYNIKGNMGLQVNFKDSSNLLIGTQRPEELRVILDKLGQKVNFF